MKQNKAVEEGEKYINEQLSKGELCEYQFDELINYIKKEFIKALQITAKAKEEEINGTLVKEARVIYGDFVQDNINKDNQIKQLQKENEAIEENQKMMKHRKDKHITFLKAEIDNLKGELKKSITIK